MQAITVLLLALTQGTAQVDASEIAACVQKLSRWLNAMRPVDKVAERALNIVCRMLKRNEKAIRKITDQQLSEWILPPSASEQSVDSPLHSQTYPMSTAPYAVELAWPPGAFDDNIFMQGSEAAFDLNPLAEPLADPDNNPTFQFGQEPYPFFFANFSTAFDHPLFGDDASQEDQGPLEDQQPSQ